LAQRAKVFCAFFQKRNNSFSSWCVMLRSRTLKSLALNRRFSRMHDACIDDRIAPWYPIAAIRFSSHAKAEGDT
jgi:hypothetical protein